MRRVEEFETWEKSKRKEQRYIRTKSGGSTQIYYLPKQHNDSTLTALEETMDCVDKEIAVARELFEEELAKINTRADHNPNAVRLVVEAGEILLILAALELQGALAYTTVLY